MDNHEDIAAERAFLKLRISELAGDLHEAERQFGTRIDHELAPKIVEAIAAELDARHPALARRYRDCWARWQATQTVVEAAIAAGEPSTELQQSNDAALEDFEPVSAELLHAIG